MDIMKGRRFTAWAGIIAVVLYIVSAALISDLPDISAPVSAWSAYSASHSAQLLGEAYIWGAVTAALFCFLTGLWALLRQAENSSEMIGAMGLAAGFIIWAIVLAGFAPMLVLGYRAGALDPTTVGVLRDSTLLGTTLSAFPTVVSVGAFAFLIARTAVLPRWIGWAGWLVVLAHLAAGAAFAHDGFFSPSFVSVFVAPPLYFLWTLVISVALLRRPRSTPAASGELASAQARA